MAIITYNGGRELVSLPLNDESWFVSYRVHHQFKLLCFMHVF